MLADPRSEALSTKFAGQWLHLSGSHEHASRRPLLRQLRLTHWLKRCNARPSCFSTASCAKTACRGSVDGGLLVRQRAIGATLRNPERRRTRVSASHVDGRLSPRPAGQRRDSDPDIGADRTSPVLRGKWVMGVLLGTPPPPPPPAVPKLDETSPVSEGKALTVRERMEVHRANGTCKQLSPADRPDRFGAREFRCHRRLAHRGYNTRDQLRRHSSSQQGRAVDNQNCDVRWHPARWAGNSAPGYRRALRPFIQTLTER